MNSFRVFIVGFIFGLFFMMAFNKSCVPEAKGAQIKEWRCVAVPPIGTKHRDAIETLAIHENKDRAKEMALWFCNKIFKTNECIIESCKLVGK